MNGHLKPMVFFHGACGLDEPRRFPARVAIFASRPFVWKQTWCDCIHKSIFGKVGSVCFVKYFTTWVACGLEISVECLGLPAVFSWDFHDINVSIDFGKFGSSLNRPLVHWKLIFSIGWYCIFCCFLCCNLAVVCWAITVCYILTLYTLKA